METVRVALQQRHRLFREGLRELLAAQELIEVVGAVASVDELFVLCGDARPGAVLVEVDPTGRDAARAAARLLADTDAPRLIGLCDTLAPHAAAVVRVAGLRVLVPRADGVVPVIRAIRGEAIAAPSLVATPDDPRAAHPTGPLTAREVDVLALVGAGHTSRQISADLNISAKTVENHKQRIFGKLGVQNQAHAVVVALRGGLLEPDRLIELARAE